MSGTVGNNSDETSGDGPDSANGGALEAQRYRSSAELLRAIPITVFNMAGTLDLRDGKLLFINSKARAVFEHPVGELHSLAFSLATGLHIWHGARRYRIVPNSQPMLLSTNLVGDNPAAKLVASAADVRRGRAEMARRIDGASNWIAVLTPLVGEPPPGVKVRPPWGMRTLIVAGVLFLVAFFTVLVFVGLAINRPG